MKQTSSGAGKGNGPKKGYNYRKWYDNYSSINWSKKSNLEKYERRNTKQK